MPAVFVPAAEDTVEVSPVQLLLIKHRLVVGQCHRLRGEALVHPVGDVALFALHRAAVAQTQHLHIPAHGGAADVPVPQILGGALLIEKAPLRPVVALLLDLAEGGPPSGAVALLGTGDTVAHQQIDHIRRKAQIVIQSRQDLQVRRFQALAQLLLRLRHQHPKAGIAGEEVRQVIRRVHRALLCRLRGLLLRGPVDESQLLQSRLRRMKAQLAPLQSTLQLLRRDTTVRPQQAQIQQRRIPVAPVQQPLHRGRGQGDALIPGMYQTAGHPPLLPSF